jgi:hypothetical protein
VRVYDHHVRMTAELLMLAGLLLVSSTAVIGFGVWGSWRSLCRLRRLISQMEDGRLVRGAKLPHRAAVAGRITTGRPGLLRAPRSGTECVWYQVEYARSPSDGDRVDRWIELHPDAELIAVADRSGTVFLTPHLARTVLEGPDIVTITAAGFDGDTAWQEAVIPPGLTVFAVGRPRRTDALRDIPTRVVEKGPWFLPGPAS